MQPRVVLQISSFLMFSDFMDGLQGEMPESLMFSLRGERNKANCLQQVTRGMHIEIRINNIFIHFDTERPQI